MTLDEIRSLFTYDAWANERFVRAMLELTEEQATRHIVSSFSSIRDTFSHIILAEWIWLRRWKGESPTSPPAWAGEDIRSLESRLREIQRERTSFLAAFESEGALVQPVSYRNLKGEESVMRLIDLLLHLANHSTYHRGQLSTMLRQVGATPPSTDLLLFQKNPVG